MNPGAILSARGINLQFGGVRALSEISLDVLPGEILAIIGPNGAGKSAFLNCISGFYRPQAGEILFEGKPITKLAPHKIPRLGIARVFQNIELNTGMTTLQNLMAARHIHFRSNFLAGSVYFGPGRREECRQHRVVDEIIGFLDMEPMRHQLVGSLPYGSRKRLDLARALALEPKLLLLDEPVAGMSRDEKQDMARLITEIHQQRQIPIVIIEHDMATVVDLADRIVVLDFGIKIAEGKPEEVLRNPVVEKAYLGEDFSY